MSAIAPLTSIRFGFSENQYRSPIVREEDGIGTRVLRSLRNAVSNVVPYSLTVSAPPEPQCYYYDPDLAAYLQANPKKPGEYRLYLNA